MGGMPPNSDPGVIEPEQSQTINPMFINPNQRTFQSFNPNLPSNMYGNVTTGRSDYQNSPYFISPEGTTPVVTQVETPQVIYNPNQEIQDRVANNRTKVDSIVAAGNGSIAPVPKILDASQSDDLYNQNFQENFKAAQDHAEKNPYGQTTGTPLSQQGFTTGESLLPPAPATTLTDKFLQSITGPVKENKVTSYSHATDNDRPAGPGDSGYDQARKLEALQSGGTGIIYKDDRREVYLDGVLIGNPKSADSANKMLAKAQAEKSGSVSTQDNTNTSGGK